jgi:ribonucleoside-diphosphate reductase alpha chain
MDMQQNISLKILFTPTPPQELSKVKLSDNSEKVLVKRYLRKGENGNPIETIEEMFWRVAYHVANGAKQETSAMNNALAFYNMMASRRFFPNSPTFTGAGTPLGQLAACFVLPVSDDMGRAEDGIFSTLRNAALIQQTGGGNGFSFSKLRPKGSLVKTSAGEATGPVGFLKVYDHAFGEIAQGGTRRGANMGVLRIDHPDIEDFISCKTNENAITNFNISIGITDSFMEAVINDEDWELIFPDVNDPRYKNFPGTIEEAKNIGIKIITHKTIRARDLFHIIASQAHKNGEPGVLFLDTANDSNPVPHLYRLEATNPCGEQWLGPYENCCLGSINLAEHCAPDGKVDWKLLEETTDLAVKFLDNVIDVNAYVPAVPELRESAERARRIGLGIMGLADLMYHVDVRYGSKESLEFASQVMEFIRFNAMKTSIALAQEKGPFPAIIGSIYDPSNLKWKAPDPIVEYIKYWDRPELRWGEILEGLLKYGIRNAAQTTIAPTGTIGTVAGCEGYGCEPVFALAYVRHVNDNGNDLILNYLSPLFQKRLDSLSLDPLVRGNIIEEILINGSCQHIEELPEDIRNTFVVSADINAEEHIRLQAALQAFVDNSLSKTINFPSNTTIEDVEKAYKLAWELGCKGLTVYVTGSREKVVLETKATAQLKSGEFRETSEEKQLSFWKDTKKPRPKILKGYTYSIDTPLGKAFITINENGGNQPFEVFINTAKAGSETAAHSEAMGRLISYVLRITSPIEPKERLKVVMEQLGGIGGGRSLGFGPNRIRSLPDGIAKALDEYLVQQQWEKETELIIINPEAVPLPTPFADSGAMKVGELCPDCGHATLINEEGCKKCYTCGYSEC